MTSGFRSPTRPARTPIRFRASRGCWSRPGFRTRKSARSSRISCAGCWGTARSWRSRWAMRRFPRRLWPKSWRPFPRSS